MFIKSLMMPRDKVFTVTPEDSLEKALETIQKHNLLSIPVCSGDKFYGSVSKYDIYEQYFEIHSEDKKEEFLVSAKVKDTLNNKIPSVSPMDDVEVAAHYLEISNIPFVAVIDDLSGFSGIVTHHAIFHEFTQLLGLNKGKKISVIAYDIPGQISKLTKIISENGADVISCAIIDPEIITAVKEIVVKVKTDNLDTIINKIKAAGFKIQ